MIDFGLEQSHLMLLGAACLAAMLALPLLAAVRRELAKFRGRCSAFTAALLVMCLLGAFVVGGTKTNGVNNLPPHPLLMLPAPGSSLQTVDEADVLRGFRLDAVTTNEGFSYAMPIDGVRDDEWHLAGGHSAYRRYELAWPFPLGTGGVSSVVALQSGGLCRTPRDDPFAGAFEGMLSFRPGVSDFWTRFGEDRQVFTWVDTMPYDNTNDITSVQVALAPDGGFAVRSNAVESVYRRVNPDDWDGDGLANGLDANPTAYDGDFFGVANALPSNANPDAYYWLDLSVTGGLGVATIRVTCDGPSDLGDHVVVARTNEVCHVPLLAGATYAVESDLPFGYSAVSSEYAGICTNDESRLSVSLPLELSFERVAMRGGTDSYVAHTSPVDVGPRILNVSGGCCSCATNGTGLSWNCFPQCLCEGSGHALSGVAKWEGYSYSFSWWGRCPCYYADQTAIDEIESRGVSLEILDASGNAIEWKNPILVGESIIVEATVGGSEMTVADFVGLFGGRIRLKVYYVDSEGEHDIAGAAIPISAATTTSQGQNVFRVSVAASWLQSNGIVRNADDGIVAKTSIDMSDTATGDSNRQDSDIFDAGIVGRLYGRARGEGNGNANAAIPEGTMNLKALQSAGTACLVACIATVRSSAKQCQQQADYVYYSCHGAHATGELADSHNRYSCNSVTEKWGDVDVVVIAGCSVLDIGNFRAESFSTATSMKRWWSAGGDSSPGEKWEAKGAKVYLGYAWTAPTDSRGGTEIATTFVGERASGKDWVESWKNANDCDAGRNACAIDCRSEPHVFWFWREVNGVSTWTSVIKGGSSW